ncbi:MAG: response regulator [Desulfuromonadales bacterium]|nr:response regulator [Desulfuromonadales bacterium]
MDNLSQRAGNENIGQATTETQAPPEAAIYDSGKVLIVEDEPEILEPLAHSLQKAGLSVLRAEDGLSACRIIGSEQPDLVLLDIMLPDLDGWEVCRLLRQHPDPGFAGIPVIMLTALGAQEDKYRGLEIGADIFLPKPYSIREVILHAGNLVRRRQQTVALEVRLKSMINRENQFPDMYHLMFHELRNQLLILNGFADLLHAGLDGKHAGICMDAIFRSSNYLSTLAEEVLLIRQMEDGRLSLEYEHFPIEDLIAEIIKVYSAPAREKCMQLRCSVTTKQATVNLSRLAVKIIFSALVDNSLKYGHAGQTISLGCQVGEGRIDLIVADQGPGIPVEEQERIFDAYYRAGDASGKPQGTGIGLHAVRVLAKAMGGDVTLESRPAHGSRFRINLPA